MVVAKVSCELVNRTSFASVSLVKGSLEAIDTLGKLCVGWVLNPPLIKKVIDGAFV